MAFLVAYLLIASFFLFEGRFRANDRARSLQRGQFDRQSTSYLIRSFITLGIALPLGWVLAYYGIARLQGPAWLA